MTQETSPSNSLQFHIKEMSIILSSGEVVSITNFLAELNLYESVFMPCRSGNIMLIDGIGLYDKLDISGNNSIRFKIQKSQNDVNFFEFYKEFKIYKVSDRKNTSSTSQTYILHFVNEDFVYSLQNKVSQSYYGPYSTIAQKILTNNLRVTNSKPSKGKSGINYIYPTTVGKKFVMPNLTPFDSLNWLAKRSTSLKWGVPDFLFFENNDGYNFVPVSYLWESPSRFTINAKPKNLSNTTDSAATEFLGARSIKVLSQFNMLNNIKDGSYAGTFVGFDTFTKTISVQKLDNTFDSTSSHGNKNSNLTDTKSKDNTDFTQMYDSRIVIYPFALPRTTQQYIKEKSPSDASVIDDTHKYIYQRRAFFSNFMQKRIELTMPGNFGLTCGSVITLEFPKFAVKEEGKSTDDTLSGKYIILGVRHIIRNKTHETLIEITTDSTRK